MTRSSWVLAFVFLLGACTSQEPKEIVGPGAPARRPTAVEDDATEAGRRQEWPRYRAKSRDAELDIAYPYRLQTHCGVDWNVDFDGSFWKAIGENRAIENGDYRGLDNPSDRGTMALQEDDRAVYESSNGVTITFSRAGESKRIAPCY